MKKRILLLVSALSVLFISSKAYAYWTNKLHFSVGIPVAYELEISVMTDEDTKEQNKLKNYQTEQEIVTENEEIPLSVPAEEEKENEKNREIETEGQEETHKEESNKEKINGEEIINEEELIQSIDINQGKSTAQDSFAVTHNEGN